ncbi:MAG: 50S rRNA methyltransferase [Waddliaceae bacterium]|nr:50S rRNA methyltransferase [Waddliaceae bacterium]
MNSTDQMELFVVCSSGLEELVQKEMEELGVKVVRQGHRGVYVTGTLRDLYRINYCSRLASRVLLPLKEERCAGKEELYRLGMQIDWTKYMTPDQTFAIDCNGYHPEFSNKLYAAQVLKDALCDQMREKYGRRPSVDTARPNVQLNLHLHEHRVTVSVDTSGQPLHKRGYRKITGPAPLQETMAAALLTMAGYDGKQTFLDPCCGSGTLLVEAAMIATRTPPGYLRRHWGFFALPFHNDFLWKEVRIQVNKGRRVLQDGKISGMEISPRVLQECKANLRSAGFEDGVHLIQGDFDQLEPKFPPNLVLCNPPHGRRLGEERALIPFYGKIGDFLKRKVEKPGKGFIFTSSPLLSRKVGLRSQRRHVVSNCGVESRLLEFDLY